MDTRNGYAEKAGAAIDAAHKAQIDAANGRGNERVRTDHIIQRTEDARMWIATAQVYATLAAAAPAAVAVPTPPVTHMLRPLGGEHTQTYCGMRLKLALALTVTYKDDYVTCSACRKEIGL